MLVSGIERYHGRLDGNIEIGLWSITEPEDSSAGNPGEFPSGSNASADMETRVIPADGRPVEIDSESYLINLGGISRWRKRTGRRGTRVWMRSSVARRSCSTAVTRC